ncbi:MAG: glycosyltransferase [Candidatus Delongbacteria bacterium]|nr:glycosyltransferase [Candidatus Delongbacteria bacterium]
MKIAVHITHEAVQKIGGIGSVIAGLITADPYKEYFGRSFLYGPLFNTEGTASSRLGKDGVVLYSGLDQYDIDKYTHVFSPIEKKYNISIVYGKRIVSSETDPNDYQETETILVHINNMFQDHIDKLKFMLWESFGIQSERYGDWDYEQYVRIAVPYTDILNAVISKDERIVHFSHEYMGMPSVLKVSIDRDKGRRKNCKTVFYAHEVSTARNIIEGHEGKDICFYGILEHGERKNRSMEDIFGDRSDFYRNELVKRTDKVDHIFAVSQFTAKEIKFLNPGIDEKKIATVYNGIPIKNINLEAKKKSKLIVQEYCRNLFNFTPDHTFTHVTRLVDSKGLWRDIMLLEELDELFHKNSKTGFYVLLSTLIGTGRSSNDIVRMEKDYGWPVLHKEGWPDLVGLESKIYDMVSHFNAKSKSIKCVFINQFGFNAHSCGNRIPRSAEWIDLRIGSDAELGMSVYEPFGIAQIETVQFGGLAVLSDACGCSSLIKEKYSSSENSFHIIDFTENINRLTIRQLQDINVERRTEIEKYEIEKNAEEIFKKITSFNDDKALKNHLETAQSLAMKIDWDYIVSKNIIPAIKDKKEL